MAGTTRTNFRGERIADGEHGRSCGSANCDRCATGFYKRPARRAARRARIAAIAGSEAGIA